MCVRLSLAARGVFNNLAIYPSWRRPESLLASSVIIQPRRKYPVLSLREFVDGIEQYLKAKGYFYKNVEVHPSKGDRSYFESDETDIRLNGVNYNGVMWDKAFFNYTIKGFACRNMASKIGSGPFAIEILKCPVQIGGVAFKLSIEVQDDRSLRFDELSIPEAERVVAPSVCKACDSRMHLTSFQGKCVYCGKPRAD